MAHVRLTLGAVLVLAVLIALPARAADRPARVYALLASGEVVAISTATGKVVARRAIGPGPEIALVTPLIARHGDVIYALTPRLGDQQLVRMSVSDLAIQERVTLRPDVRFTVVLVTRAGVIHLLGTRADAPVLVTLRDGVLGAPVEIRPADGRDWHVIHASLSANERRLAVDYHGMRSSGADVIDPAIGVREPCAKPHRAFGCLTIIHGASAFMGDTVVGTAATDGLVSYRRGASRGRLFDTRLPRNHLMSLGRDPSTGLFVASVTCQVAKAIAVINLSRRTTRVSRGVCGDMVVASNGLAAVAAAVPNLRGRGITTGVYLVNIRTGRRAQFTRTASPMALTF